MFICNELMKQTNENFEFLLYFIGIFDYQTDPTLWVYHMYIKNTYHFLGIYGPDIGPGIGPGLGQGRALLKWALALP